MSDFASKPGWVGIYYEGRPLYSRWKSRVANWKAHFIWCCKLIKQLTCWHPQWYFNAEARMSLPVSEAHKWYHPFGDKRTEGEIQMIRTNYLCARCGKWSHRYRPIPPPPN